MSSFFSEKKPGCTDLRKGALKLSLIVQDEIELNPFIKSIFMFCSKNRKTIYLRQLSLIDFIRNNIVIDFVLLIKSNYYSMLSAIHDIFII